MTQAIQVGDVALPPFLDESCDLASPPFPDGSCDRAVGTVLMHHWADPMAGLAEIGRVLKPSGQALVWDFRPGPPAHTHGSSPRVAGATLWRWPWRSSLTQRIELVGVADSPAQGGS